MIAIKGHHDTTNCLHLPILPFCASRGASPCLPLIPSPASGSTRLVWKPAIPNHRFLVLRWAGGIGSLFALTQADLSLCPSKLEQMNTGTNKVRERNSKPAYIATFNLIRTDEICVGQVNQPGLWCPALHFRWLLQRGWG